MMNNLFDAISTYAKQDPIREAIVSADRTVSYAELNIQVDQLSAELIQMKIQRLAIWGVNSVNWILIDLAARKAGITVIPIPLFFIPDQVKHLLQDSQIDSICVTDTGGDIEEKCGGKNYAIPEWMINLTEHAGRRDVSTSDAFSGQFIHLLDHQENPEQADIKLNPSQQPSKITYTSGSTGTPKGVCLAEETIDSITASLSNALVSSHLGRHLCLIPFATLLENIAGIYVALSMGRSVVVEEVSQFGLISNHEFNVQYFVDAVRKYQIESVILLPQMLKAIVEYIAEHGSADFATLKFIAVGGGKVSPDLLSQCQRLNLPVYEGYGLSECASVVSLNLPNARKIGSVGRILPHVEVKIEQNAEVVVKGNAMLGYVNDMAASPYIHTGDAGYFDEEGYLYITGRIKQIIVSSFGRNISPEWVESNSLSEAEIHQIAIFGEAQPHLSAVIYAKASTSDEGVAAAVQKANARMPDYAQIKHWCRAAEPFSLKNQMLTDNGKLRRNQIRQHFYAALQQS
ncbi:AMP-binding protein [Acinetobacter sp. ANC 4282]|uniref:AMP-dependent synthetase/ligase domain-containing protein n=1 Tax=Acinetobacter johnsonii TaxID=40214 RepID=A0A3S9AKC1_ACIJO|nr:MULTISPECIES: AMP-binding protein [Acinetobacter]AZN64057.1 hypothetical protein CFH90_08485 [Acinetobacter johnsonii]NNH16899.1 AMP-binding protein [Acinetobacter terrae]